MSLRAVHVPGELNHAADELSRQPPFRENGNSTRGTPADLEKLH